MIGRQSENEILNKDYKTGKSSIIVVYGRRRIGKSYLINEHLKSKRHFKFEGIEGQSSAFQLQSFVKKLIAEFELSNIKASSVSNWEDALNLLAKNVSSSAKNKFIIFFDEFQWMSGGRSQLPSVIKKIWDNEWQNKNIQLILCGSVSSYMIGNVIKSKALYGRIGIELKIDFLTTSESVLFFSKNKSDLEIMKYLVTFGGVPKYLVDIKQSLSFDENISQIFFNKTSGYVHEYEKVFYSQFKEHKTYEKIVQFLALGTQNLEGIAKHLKIKSGGGLKSYLENLEKAQFIRSYFSNPNNRKSKIIHYRLTDPFLRFYFAFVYPNRKLILESKKPSQVMNKIVSNKLDIFLGYAFENYCLINAYEIAEKLGIESKLISYGPMALKNIAQIDLVFFRNDQTINVAEIKFQKAEVETNIIVDLEKKTEAIKEFYSDYSIQKSLVTLSSPCKKLIFSEYFDQIVTVKNWLHH